MITRFAPKGEVVIEVDSPGNEFYIVLGRKAEFYLKDHAKSEHANELIKNSSNWESIPPHSSRRKRSGYDGIVSLNRFTQGQILRKNSTKAKW